VSEGAFAVNVLAFGRMLRDTGLDIHHGRLLDALQALTWIGVPRRSDVRTVLRGLLVHRHDDLSRFDRAFDLFFAARRLPASDEKRLALSSLGEQARVIVRTPPGASVPARLEAIEAERSAARAVGAWSSTPLSRTTDFAELSPADLDRAAQVLEQLPWRLSVRRTRRWQRAATGAVDLRPAIRRNLTRGADLVDLPRRRRRVAARPIVVIADVSGSMERYSRILLHFAAGLARSGARVESFVFATSLTRVTDTVSGRHRRQTIAQLTRTIPGWSGGTRIGESLRQFNVEWSRRVMRHSPVVLIVSDGWDRGDPAALERELARVRRNSRRLIWLNPLLGSAEYEPLTRGMQAALRHIDDFLPAHNLQSIEQLTSHLGDLPSRSRPVGSDWRTRSESWS
jgi:uncharacterized protein with von Willebrand factor type A (vWA) domain